MATTTTTQQEFIQSKQQRMVRKIWENGSFTLITLVILAIFLMPFGYGIVTSLKSEAQIATLNAPILPSSALTYTYEGEVYDVYQVPTEDGVQEWALVRKGREDSSFININNPEAGLIEWEGRWRTLEPVWQSDYKWSNYEDAWNAIDFGILLRNTVLYSIFSTFGAVFSSALVAFGFARFDVKFKGILFGAVMATIILPSAVTLLPMYAVFNQIGWVGTWLPLVVPVYFSNAYNIFLLRQFFLGVPRDLDEAATIDGAGMFRIFFQIILPNAIPALTAVTLFHFFFAWNDFFGPLIYLAGKPNLFPITVGLTGFNNLYAQQTNLIQAAALIAAVIPIVVFFMAQKTFLEGVVVQGGAGVEK
jgi:multiple sugar transport system permease protein